jgi:hypothetical protein
MKRWIARRQRILQWNRTMFIYILKRYNKCYAQYYRKVKIEVLGIHQFIFIRRMSSVLCLKPLYIHLDLPKGMHIKKHKQMNSAITLQNQYYLVSMKMGHWDCCRWQVDTSSKRNLHLLFLLMMAGSGFKSAQKGKR